jgi:protein TonB
MSGRLIVWGLVSLAIHAGAAGAGFAMLRGGMPPLLFIDLMHGLLVIDEPAASSRGAEAPLAPPSTPVSARFGGARGERRAVGTSPRSAPAPRVSPAETSPPPTPTPSAVPEPAPVIAESPAAPPPPPTVVEPPPSPTVESAAPRLAGPPSEPPASRRDNASAAPPGGPAGGEAQPAAAAAPASTGRGSADGGAAGGGGGGPDGSLALAIPGGTGRGETAEYDAYYALVRRRIVEALTYPPAARRRSLTGTVQVELEIQPTGVISRVEVVASSSHRVLDDAAVDTVRGLGRVPFPSNVRPRLLLMRQPIVFELR